MMNTVVRVSVCPNFHKAIELIGRRWTGAILRVMQGGATRFSDIADSVPGLSDRLLSERLKELELEGIIFRRVYPDIPVRIEYTMTEKGAALGEVLDAISHWAETWLANTPELEKECDRHLKEAALADD
jgi:DNA-binding HxlR family transcriptional regulator